MNFKDCIDFAKANPVCYLATVEGNQPRVRAMGLYSADENGFCFNTQTVKSLYKQLCANRKVEVCFYGGQPPKMMRVSGEVEFVEDPALKGKLLEDRAFLKPFKDIVCMFRISKGEAFFWTMADSMKEAQLPRIKFGK